MRPFYRPYNRGPGFGSHRVGASSLAEGRGRQGRAGAEAVAPPWPGQDRSRGFSPRRVPRGAPGTAPGAVRLGSRTAAFPRHLRSFD